jgi:hypothetical protein
MEDGWRHRTAEYVREPGMRGWFQDGRKLRNVKASKAFIWPKDGKNGTKWGRIKDVFSNKGPDIYVAFGANKGDCVTNRPTRSQWAGHSHLDDRGINSTLGSAAWTRNAALGGRKPGLSYDFRTRKYCKPYRGMWTDAIWQPQPYRNERWNPYPEAIRRFDGVWHQDRQYLPQFRGGPVNNEFGLGIPGLHQGP